MDKKRVIKSHEKLEPTLKELLSQTYPDGFEDSLMRLKGANDLPFFVVPLETNDATYLIKVPVVKNGDGGYDIDYTDGPLDDYDEPILPPEPNELNED
mgnify:FL=1